jgi:hypothetical protein
MDDAHRALEVAICDEVQQHTFGKFGHGYRREHRRLFGGGDAFNLVVHGLLDSSATNRFQQPAAWHFYSPLNITEQACKVNWTAATSLPP